MDADFEEGYADGLAGAGMQARVEAVTAGGVTDWQAVFDAERYENGFVFGSVDRKVMLR